MSKNTSEIEETKIIQESSTPNIRMMGDRILVVPSDEKGERSTKTGLVIPATANEQRRLLWGDVISIGPNTRNIEIGDRILYTPDSGYEVEVAGQDYVILRERDVHAVAQNNKSSTTGMYL